MKKIIAAALLLCAQVTVADVATRAAAAKSVHANPEARSYNFGATGVFLGVEMRVCAPAGTNLSPEAAAFTLVASVSAGGKVSDIEVEPQSAVATCLATRLHQTTLPLPPASLLGEKGFPLLIEMKLTDGARTGPRRVAITPVFSQLVAFTFPQGFAPAFSNSTATDYVQQMVPGGENVQNWTEMISLTGANGLALPQAVTAGTALQSIGAHFQQLCPQSFVWKPVGRMDANGHEGHGAIVGCGSLRLKSGETRSEVAFVVAMKGSSDIYTIQWAERAAPVDQAPEVDDAKWRARVQQLLPIRICNRVPGEAAPYPSCIDPPGASQNPNPPSPAQ